MGWVNENNFIRTQPQQDAGAEGINLGLVGLDHEFTDGSADIVLDGPAEEGGDEHFAGHAVEGIAAGRQNLDILGTDTASEGIPGTVQGDMNGLAILRGQLAADAPELEEVFKPDKVGDELRFGALKRWAGVSICSMTPPFMMAT